MLNNNLDLFWLVEEMVRKMEINEMQANYTSGVNEEIMKKEALERFLEKHNGEYTPHYKFVDDTYYAYEGVVSKSRERTSFQCVIPHYVHEKIDAIKKHQIRNYRFGVLGTSDTVLDYLGGYYSIGIERALKDTSLKELIEDFIYDFLIDENTYPGIGYKRRVFFKDSKGKKLYGSIVLAIDPPNCIDPRPHFVICFGHED